MFSQRLSSADKDAIKRSFSKAALQYEAHASLQRETAEELLKSIICPVTTHRSPLTNVLDVGCGTGLLTYSLLQALSEAHIYGCDISHPMIRVARGKGQGARGKRVRLFAADGGSLPFQNETFDMVVSNLTFQWIPDLESAFAEAYRVLKPGRLVAFTIPGPKTLQELRRSYAEASEELKMNGLPPFIQFAHSAHVTKALEKACFSSISVKNEEHIQVYPDMWTLLKTIKSLGAGNPFKRGDHSLARGAILRKMAEVYETRFGVKELFQGDKNTVQHGIYAMYEIMYVCARK